MSRLKKLEIITTIESMLEVNNTISKSNGLNYEAVANALSQCQEAAISIGNSIESKFSDKEDIIHLLENYCEELYQLSINIADSNLRIKQCKKINKTLLNVLNDIKHNLPEDKKEIVFFPYQASMWDSFESLWKKLIADVNCDVYVVPIPYFDKNEDGSLGTMHYEGDKYPDNVPIVSYKDYDVVNRHPDVIYIHNPYDNFNKVTSVHPSFYAKELRKHTDKLVYIPYFVAINGKVDRNFCTTPGVFYAHEVIVQAENTKEIYIEELQKYEKENNLVGVFGDLDKKIVVGGNPKFDKVREAKIEDFIIPEKWNEFLYSPNGSRRKVILYNTTIASMLVDTPKMLDKIEDVFKIFQNNTDMVLLWRPHPTLKATIKSMRNDCYERYVALEEDFIKNGYGIYDDTPDMYLSITLSDAYYGDWSSLVELYRQTGKPIMIQNTGVLGD